MANKSNNEFNQKDVGNLKRFLLSEAACYWCECPYSRESLRVGSVLTIHRMLYIAAKGGEFGCSLEVYDSANFNRKRIKTDDDIFDATFGGKSPMSIRYKEYILPRKALIDWAESSNLRPKFLFCETSTGTPMHGLNEPSCVIGRFKESNLCLLVTISALGLYRRDLLSDITLDKQKIIDYIKNANREAMFGKIEQIVIQLESLDCDFKNNGLGRTTVRNILDDGLKELIGKLPGSML